MAMDGITPIKKPRCWFCSLQRAVQVGRRGPGPIYLH